MASKTRAVLKAMKESLLADNTSKDISPQDMRDILEDLIDSFSNLLDDGLAEVHLAEVTISSANLLAMFTTPKTILPAPGAGKMNSVISADYFYDRGTVNYATTTDFYLAHNAPGGEIHASGASFAGGADLYGNVALDSQLAASSAQRVNTPLVAYCPSANPTAGDGTITLYVLYQVITLPA